MLKVLNLSKFYTLQKHFYLKKERHFIFENLNFELALGQNLLIKGESGSGKSTLARILCMLERPSSGQVLFENEDIFKLKFSAQRLLRKHIQYIFQDQKLALNPYKSAKSLLFSVYKNYKLEPDLKALDALFELFELDKSLLSLKPEQLSGGQASRLGIIRALILKPKLLICDEITSALDLLSTQKILNYLQILQEKQAISYIFISHKEEFLTNFHPKILNLSSCIAKLK